MATLKDIYEALRADNAPVHESYDEFEEYMTSGPNHGYEHRKAFYDALRADGAPIHESYEDFSRELFVGKRAATVAGSDRSDNSYKSDNEEVVQSQPAQVQGWKPSAVQQMEFNRQMGDMNASLEMQRRQLEQSKEDVAKGNKPGSFMGEREVNPQTGEIERNYYTVLGDKVSTPTERSAVNAEWRDWWENNTEEGKRSRALRLKDEAKDRASVFEMSLASLWDRHGDGEAGDAAERAWAAAEADYGRRVDANHRLAGLVGMRAVGGTNAAVYGQLENLDNFAERLSTHDLDKLMDDAWGNLGEKGRQSLVDDCYGMLRRRYPDVDDISLYNYAKELARKQSDLRMYKLAVVKNAPKSAVEYLARKVGDANLITSLGKGVAVARMGKTGDMSAYESANEQYRQDGHKVLDVAGTVTGFALDPTTWMSGGVGGAIGKGALWLGGKWLAGRGASKLAVNAAAREFGTSMTGRIVGGVVGGAANFGTFEGVKEMENQFAHGGHIVGTDEDGRYINEGYSASAVGGQALHGFGMGAAIGWLTPVSGNVADKLVRGTSSTMGKVAGRAGVYTGATMAEGTIFSIPEWMEGNRDGFDVWTDNMAMMVGFKAKHMLKSAGGVLGDLKASFESPTNGSKNRLDFESRLRMRMDAPSDGGLALTKDEEAELKRYGYDLRELVESAEKNGSAAEGSLIAENAPEIVSRLTDMVNDPRISEAARAKMYYYATGRKLPMSTVMRGEIIGDGKGGFIVESQGANGVITSRSFKNRKAADLELERINRQTELNHIEIGERYRQTVDFENRLQEACREVAAENGWNAVEVYRTCEEARRNHLRGGDKQFDEAQQNILRKVTDAMGEFEETGVTDAIRGSINEKYGVDIDAAIRKEANRRTQAEQAAIDEYLGELIPDKAKDYPVEDAEAEDITNKLLTGGAEDENNSVNLQGEDNETADGERFEQDNGGGIGPEGADAGGRMVADPAGVVAGNRDRGYIRVYEEGLGASHYAHTDYSERDRREAESERLVGIARQNGQYIEKHALGELGKRILKPSGESEVYIDDEQGKVYKVKDPAAKSPMKGNVRPEDAIYEHLVHNKYFPETSYGFEGISDDMGDVRIVLSQDYVESVGVPTKVQIESALAEKGLYPEGDYRYGNEEISVTDVTGDNALVGADGKVYFIDPIIDFKKPVGEILGDGIADNSDESDGSYKPGRYTSGEIKVRNSDGSESRGVLTGYVDEEGKHEYYVEGDLQHLHYATEEELDNILSDYQPDAPQEDNKSDEIASASAGGIDDNSYNSGDSDNSDDSNNSDKEGDELEVSSLQSLPRDEKGNPIFEQAKSPEAAWDALVEFSEGDAATAKEIADTMAEEKRKAFEKAQRFKPKGKTPAEILASKKANAAELAKTQAEYEHWLKMAGVEQSRQNAIRAEQEAEARRLAAERAEQDKVEKAAREEAERIEREALNGIPEWHMDTPENARARGSRRFSGQLFTRQEPVQGVAGKEVEVKFSQKDLPKGRVAVIEAEQLQPSHLQGQRNPMFFIDEAQPKNRAEAVSTFAAKQIAEGIRPEEITGSATAYTGAPTVNARGEVIQGNNRSDALRYLWENNLPQQQVAYKQYLVDNAEQLGLDPKAVNAMQQPVLVNMLDVDDYEAIRLGQMTAQDTESGGTERIKPKNVAQKLGDDMRQFANMLLRTGDEESTFGQLVDRNGIDVVKWMSQVGAISNTQYQSAFDCKGNLTAEAKNDLQKVLYQSVFKGGSQQLEEMFDRLPAKAQRAILATAFRDMDSPFAGKMISEIQASIAAYNQLMEEPSFRDAKRMEEVVRAVGTFMATIALDDRFEQYMPADNFSNYALHLAAMYKASDMSQTTIASYFNQMYDLAQGKKAATLFEEADTTEYPLADVIKKVLNVDYKPAKNGNNYVAHGGADVALLNQVGQGGELRGNEPPASGEQTPAGTEPSDRGAGVADDSRGGGTPQQDRADKKEEVRSLTTDEAIECVADMEHNAPAAQLMPLTVENWDNQFPDGKVATPIGEVKMGEHQFLKLMREGRNSKLGMIRPTLEHPHIIVEVDSEAKEGATAERPTSYIFIKSFKKADGSRYYYFTSISVSKAGMEVVVSNQEKSRNKILRLLTEGSVIWRAPKDAATASVEQQGLEYVQPTETETATNGSEITPQSTSISSTKPVSASSSDIETEPGGKRNGTATPQSELYSEGKDNTLSKDKQILEGESSVQSSDDKGVEQERPSVQAAVDAALAEVNISPTPAQAEAGNYKKGHIVIGDFDITIENPAGSTRKGVDADGKEWQTTMANAYGYIKGTESVDGDHIDVFLHTDMDEWNGRKVFVVDQTNDDGSFDEHKVMLGFNDKDEAMSAYLANYDATWAEKHPGLRISEINLEDFDKWIKSSHRKTKPFADYKSIRELKVADYVNIKKEVSASSQGSVADYSTVSKITDNAPTEAQKNDVQMSVGEAVKGNQPVYEAAKGMLEAAGIAVHEVSGVDSVLKDGEFALSSELGSVGRKGVAVRELRSADGVVYGWTVGGEAYLNRDAMNPETPVYEYTHLWDLMVQRENPELWSRGKELMQQSGLWDEVRDDPAYADIRDDEDAVVSEVHARLTGERGAEVLERMVEDARKDGALAVAEAVSLVSRLRQWLREMFEGLKKTLGKWSKRDLNELTAEQFVDMSLRDLVEGINPNAEIRRGEQARIVTEANPMLDDYHRGVRKREDVMTFDEVLAEAEAAWDEYGDLTYPDMDIDMLRQAKRNGVITIYSSNPIEAGVFVTPSRMIAEDYAGGGHVYEKQVSVDDVAWTGEDEGQFAPSASGDYHESDKADTASEAADGVELIGWDEPGPAENPFLNVGADDNSVGELSEEYGHEKSPSKNRQDLTTRSGELLAPTSTGNAKLQKVSDNLRGLAEKYSGQTSSHGALTDFAQAIDAKGVGVSKYAKIELPNGKEAYIRLSNHNANAATYAERGNNVDNVSIVIKSRRTPNTFQSHPEVELTEYVYATETIRKDGNVLSLVAESLRRMIETGEYVDLSGKAIVNHSPETNFAHEPSPAYGKPQPKQMDAESPYNSTENGNFANSYETKDGETIKFSSENPEAYGLPEAKDGTDDSRTGAADLQRQGGSGLEARNNRLNTENGEFSLVERVFTETGSFNFTSGERIESADDVAFIFSALEDKAKEHSFVVLVKDGKPTVVELGMGSFNATMVDIPTAALAYDRIRPDEVYFVHNHPSGNLKCSPQDVQMLKKFEEMCGVPVHGVIINLKTGHYGTFDTSGGYSIGSKRTPDSASPLTVHTLDKQIFAADYDPMMQPQVRSSEDVAAFLNSHRMGDRAKVSFLILSRANKIVGNIHTPYTNIPTDADEMARYISERVIQFGGENAILYGDFAIDHSESGAYNRLKQSLQRVGGTNLLDVVTVEGNHTRSANDEGMLYEPGGEYGESANSDIRFRFGDSRESFSNRQQSAVENRGTVMAGLNDAEVNVVDVPRHSYEGHDILNQATQAAISRYANKVLHYNNHGMEFDYEIRPQSLKYAANHSRKSENAGVHVAVMDSLDKVISESIELMEHPDVNKMDGKRTEANGYNRDALMHRFIGAVSIDGQVFRVVTTLKEHSADKHSRHHTYEVVKIEVPDTKMPSTSNATATRAEAQVEVANLLKGAEIHNKTGEKILQESRLADERRYQQEMAQTAPEAKSSHAEKLSKKFNTPIRIVEDPTELTHDDPEMQKRMRGSKGFYNPVTGEVVVVVPNNVTVEDVAETVFHEVVAHKGLREIIGEENYDAFCDEVYDHLKDDLKQQIDEETTRRFVNEPGKGYEHHRRVAVDEMFGRMSEKGFEEFTKAERSIWAKLKAKVLEAINRFLGSLKLPKWVKLGDNELRYMLWKSHERLRGKEDYVAKARDVAKRGELGLYQYDILFRDGMSHRMESELPKEGSDERSESVGRLVRYANERVESPGRIMMIDSRKTLKEALEEAGFEDKTVSRYIEMANERGVIVAENGHEIRGGKIAGTDIILIFAHAQGDGKQVYANYLHEEIHNACENNPLVTRAMHVLSQYIGESMPDFAYEVRQMYIAGGEVNDEVISEEIVANGISRSLASGEWESFVEHLPSEALPSLRKIITVLGYENEETFEREFVESVNEALGDRSSASSTTGEEHSKGEEKLGGSRRENSGLRYGFGETGDIWKDHSVGLEERITNAAIRHANNHAADLTLRNDAMRAVTNNLQSLLHSMRNRGGTTQSFAGADRKVEAGVADAMNAQAVYDRSTVKRVADLARILMQHGYLSGMTSGEMQRLLSAVKNATAMHDPGVYVQKIMDIMVDNQLRNGETTLRQLLAIRGSKVDARGVEVQGVLDVDGQRIMEVVKEAMSLTEDKIHEDMAEALNRMSDPNQTIADNAAIEYAGLNMALDYVQNIADSKAEEKTLRNRLKTTKEDRDAGRMADDAYKQYVETTEDAIRKNKVERAEAYFNLVGRLSDSLRGSIENAKAFLEAEKARVNEIHHDANSDMEGRATNEHHKDDWKDKVVNNGFVQSLFSPLATFDQVMRVFGNKSANGEGYLWNRFMRGWVVARNKKLTGVKEKFARLDAKAAELFGKRQVFGRGKSYWTDRTWGDIIRMERKLPKATVSFWDGGEMRDHELTQGNLLYIYMVDKMTDGRMKLRRMGITEQDITNIENFLDPRFKALGDWLQDEFLVATRNEYNETHKRMFGASMAAIEDYFPLKILANARIDKEDDVNQPNRPDGITTKTGSIIKRGINNLALDITGADALIVMLDYIIQMEHWNAYAEWNRDLNTLRTYKRFRNQVINMTTVYGGGSKLWENLNDLCLMAAGDYRPPVAKFDKGAVNIAKGVSAATVSFRMFTALKQLLSAPAYAPEVSIRSITKSIANPYGDFKWCMENMPIFRERWQSRISGDPRLLKNEKDWNMWRSRIMEICTRIGMTPNAFVDAVTVSIGARAMYETRLKQYLREGYLADAAEERAKQDAAILFNQTQQSSESPFLSTMQVDRSWLSVLYTLFRNSSMSYTRQVYDASRNLKRNLTPGQRAKSVEFMTKQILRDWDAVEDGGNLPEYCNRFNRQLGAYSQGQMPQDTMFELGMPCGAMSIFLPDLPIVMRQRVMRKGSEKKHDIDIMALKDMPNYLAKPIFVFSRNSDTIGVLTEMRDRKGKNVCVAIEMSREIQTGTEMLVVNDVRSIHGREVENIVLPIAYNGALRWVDKEKGLRWLSFASQPDQQVVPSSDLDMATKVVESFENPKTESQRKKEDRARVAAENRFKRQMRKDVIRLAIFGFILEFAWNLGPYLLYIILGNDENEKDKMKDDAATHAMFGSLEGLTGGDVMSSFGNMAVSGEWSFNQFTKDMPIASDINNIANKFIKGKNAEAINDIIFLVVQSGIGMNPQSITDAVVAIMDICGDDPALSHEVAICVSRVLQVPQSQIDKMYFDEIGLSGEEASKLTPAQLAQRYAEYQVKRGTPLAPWSWDDEERTSKYLKSAETKMKERLESQGDADVIEAYGRLCEGFEDVNKHESKRTKAKEEHDMIGFAEETAWLHEHQQEYQRYRLFKKLDKKLSRISKMWLASKSPEEAALIATTIPAYRAGMVKAMQAETADAQQAAIAELRLLMNEFYAKYQAIQPTPMQPNR